MSWYTPGRPQAECSNGLACAGRNAADEGGMRVLSVTLDREGRCVQCVARGRVPAPEESEAAPALFDPEASA